MDVNDTKIYQKIKNKSLLGFLGIEKNTRKWERACYYYHYKKLILLRNNEKQVKVKYQEVLKNHL